MSRQSGTGGGHFAFGMVTRIGNDGLISSLVAHTYYSQHADVLDPLGWWCFVNVRNLSAGNSCKDRPSGVTPRGRPPPPAHQLAVALVGTSGSAWRERAGRRGGKTLKPRGRRAKLRSNPPVFRFDQSLFAHHYQLGTFAYVLNTWSHAPSQQTPFVVFGAPLSS